MKDITLYIQSFAACGPNIGCIRSMESGREIKIGNDCDDDWTPDTSFIPTRRFRRISRLSKMAMFSSHYASINIGDGRGGDVFCSRYGEMGHTMRVLRSISEGDLVSPMDFSYSVHNTGQGLTSILNQDTRPATVISSRYDAIEQSLIKAYAQLRAGDKSVLIVYAEDKMPDMFHDFVGDDIVPMSFGVVVSLSPGKTSHRLTLEARESIGGVETAIYGNAHACKVMMALARGRGQVHGDAGRLNWVITIES